MEIEESSSDPRPCTILELWKISLPLMISNFACLFMMFVDRVFLDYYSSNALISATSAGTWAWAFMGGVGVISSVSEVFVAQYFGANKPANIGSAVWQMIWLALFSTLFFLPMAFLGSSFLFQSPTQTLHRQYFSYLMIFGPFYSITTALCGFYIGIGKTKILIYLAILANLLNIFLDGLFIFGVPGILPAMGIKGAAIATSLGYVFQAVVLLLLFLRKKEHQEFQTNAWKINPSLFRKAFRVGLPQGVFYMLELMGFAIFYELMSAISKDHIIISGICSSFAILLSFFIEGLSRGVTAMSGNFIGAKKPKMIDDVLRSGIYLQCTFSLIIGLIFFMPNQWIQYVFPDAIEYISSTESKESLEALWFCLFCVFLYISFEGIRWVIAGILTAAGDTFFLLITGSCSVWLLLIFPVYFIVLQNALSVSTAWVIFALYSLACCGIYFRRFQRGAWKNIDLINE